MSRKSRAESRSAPPNGERRELTAGERRLATLIMWSLPILFFALLEGGLRLFGYGDSYPLFIPLEGAPEYLMQNRDVARRYFVRETRVPTGIGDVFISQKDTSTVRIFVQGGSSAAGYPYYYGGSFSRMLEQRLQQTFPGRNVEVVNTGLAAVNTYTLLDLVDEIIDEEPDAVLIYAGHNEFYGALGVGSSESFGRYRAVVNTYLALDDLRLVQLLRSALVAAGSSLSGRTRGAPPGTTLMERMVGSSTIPLHSKQYEQGLAQFRGNLRAMLDRYRSAGIPIFIGTLASNERSHAPFVSGLAPDTDAEAWNEAMARGRAALSAADVARPAPDATTGDGALTAAGNLDAALDAFDAAISIDTLSAASHFAKAYVLDRMGRYEEARRFFLAAKDRDELRFRATEEMNAILREEAATGNAIVVETQNRLAQAAQDGIIGSDLMLEHLHPNVDGYFLLADAYYGALRQAGLFGQWSRYVPTALARSEVLFTEVDSLFGAYRLRQLMGAWPFQPAGSADRSMDTVRAGNRIEQIALDLHGEKITWYEATNRLREYYAERGEFHRALRAALAVVQQYPFLPRPYAEAADVLLKQGRPDEALAYFAAANDIEESAAVHLVMGRIKLLRQGPAPAITQLERARDMDPGNPDVLQQLGRAYIAANRLDDARRTAEALLAIDPGNDSGRQMLAWLQQSGDS